MPAFEPSGPSAATSNMLAGDAPDRPTLERGSRIERLEVRSKCACPLRCVASGSSGLDRSCPAPRADFRDYYLNPRTFATSRSKERGGTRKGRRPALRLGSSLQCCSGAACPRELDDVTVVVGRADPLDDVGFRFPQKRFRYIDRCGHLQQVVGAVTHVLARMFTGPVQMHLVIDLGFLLQSDLGPTELGVLRQLGDDGCSNGIRLDRRAVQLDNQVCRLLCGADGCSQILGELVGALLVTVDRGEEYSSHDHGRVSDPGSRWPTRRGPRPEYGATPTSYKINIGLGIRCPQSESRALIRTHDDSVRLSSRPRSRRGRAAGVLR